METLQQRVDSLSKEFEKLKNVQMNISLHSNNQKYEDCWNKSLSTTDQEDRVSSQDESASNPKTLDKSSDIVCVGDHSPDYISSERKESFSSSNIHDGNQENTSPMTNLENIPLFVMRTENLPHSPTSNSWQDIEVRNLVNLLHCKKPKRFFRLDVDFHDVKASLKCHGRLCVDPLLLQSMRCYSEDVIHRYVLLQESSLDPVNPCGTMIGVAMVTSLRPSPVGHLNTVATNRNSDNEIQITYLSLSRTNKDLSCVTMHEVGKIKTLLSDHVENLKKKVVHPYIGDIFVSPYVHNISKIFI